ncbi:MULTISPECIES: O-antigen ligase [Pseudomonas]|uniref:Pilus assembly protein n=1 Tax=Pseudomonas fluorescens LMG 5329 TaxID=1324332 RepID=A0A0A1YYL7_PSEFL|nr:MULTISPECIES: O-antigen ligase family protein [Pseudomonas]KGE67048.1 pilus assembly protein [Pseudomonas fluorescens LMG 5329]NWE00379.1 O-antigen ligase family protein [Pseudomonas sp. IPO3749]NWF18561.1 O-antigen ligase family protein [Pseudomonas sp. IPO3749]
MALSVEQRGGFFLVAVVCLLVVGICAPFSGHDLQRTLQIAIGACAALYGLSITRVQRLVDRPTALGLALIMVLGLVSSLRAHQPLWALAEMAVFVSCGAIAVAFALLRHQGGESLDRALILIVVLLCLMKSIQYLYAGALAFINAGPTLDPDVLLSGFSNKRFYGQFQTFTLPLLALPLLIPTLSRSLKVAVFALLCTWWLIAIAGGTRGTWLGMGVAGGVLAVLGPWGRRWLGWQLAAMLGGLLLYGLVFKGLADYLGIEIVNIASERLTTSLSGRGPIWWQAWHMLVERPWLGFGPMQFADIANSIAAHPHQAILQWASEWGVPSALCVAVLAWRGSWATVGVLRERAPSAERADLLRLCLFAALVGALVQSMVDGVIVMPNSQVWLALVVGWLMALHVWRSPQTTELPLAWCAWKALGVLAVGLLVVIAVRDVPHIEQAQRQYLDAHGHHLQPRFWAQGVIAR